MSTDVFRQGGTKSNDGDKARRAVAAFRKMQPTLSAYARALTGRPDVRVEMTAAGGKTDGKIIYYRPPVALGDETPHHKSLCSRRGADKRLLCPACAIREQILIVIYHEIGHIAYDSFHKTSKQVKAEAVEHAAREVGSRYAEAIANRIKNAPSYQRDSYIALSGLISPFLPGIVNSLEDARINRSVYKARPGTRVMFEADANRIFTDGVEQENEQGKTVTVLWKDYPVNMQAAVGVYCKASGYKYQDWFIPEVVEALDDPEMDAIIKRMETVRSITGVYELSFSVLELMRRYGFFKHEEDPQFEGGEGDSSEQSDGEAGEDQQPEASSEGGEGEGSDGGHDEPLDQDDSGGGSDSSESDSEASDGDEDRELSSTDSDSGAGEDESNGADGSAGSTDDAEGGDGSSGSSDADAEAGSNDASGAGAGDADQDAEGDVSDDSSEDSADGQDASGSGTGGASQGAGDDNLESGSVEGGDVDLQDAGPEGEDRDEPPSEEASSGPEMGDDISDDHLEDEDGSDVDHGLPEQEDQRGGGDGEESPIDSGADEGLGGIKVNPFEGLDMGTPEQVEGAVHEIAHPEERPETVDAIESDDAEVIEVAIIQGMYFETPSTEIRGVREHYYDSHVYRDGMDLSRAWDARADAYRQGQVGDFSCPESILGPALLRMRVAFANNKRATEERHRRSGKVDGRVLGRRAHFGDERLFKARRMPGKRDYFVLIGVDISGSTVGENIILAKRAAMAQAELCDRIGVKFAVYCHTGDYHGGLFDYESGLDMDIYHIKDPDEPWTEKTKQRLQAIGPCAVNLDGHTIEFYRKILDARTETDRILLYYTDGKMPAANHDEELEILLRELRIFKQKGYTMLGVGINTDSPTRYGLDTVMVTGDQDISKVVKHLERRLTKV